MSDDIDLDDLLDDCLADTTPETNVNYQTSNKSAPENTVKAQDDDIDIDDLLSDDDIVSNTIENDEFSALCNLPIDQQKQWKSTIESDVQKLKSDFYTPLSRSYRNKKAPIVNSKSLESFFVNHLDSCMKKNQISIDETLPEPSKELLDSYQQLLSKQIKSNTRFFDTNLNRYNEINKL
ncbi:hypothetical protein WA158_001712 [Blastocystis sp. Blastoise]